MVEVISSSFVSFVNATSHNNVVGTEPGIMLIFVTHHAYEGVVVSLLLLLLSKMIGAGSQDQQGF